MNNVTKTFIVAEPDLALLERSCAIMHEALQGLPAAYMRPDMQVAIEECKRILSDVRWGYGPMQSVSIVMQPRTPEH